MYKTIPTERLISPRPLVQQAKRGKRGHPLTAKSTEDAILLFLEGLSGNYSPSSGWGCYTRSASSDGTTLNCNSSTAAYFNPIGGLVVLSSPISRDVQRQCRKFNIPYVSIRDSLDRRDPVILAKAVQQAELSLTTVGRADVDALIDRAVDSATIGTLSRIQEYL